MRDIIEDLCDFFRKEILNLQPSHLTPPEPGPSGAM
jgi:hypothetical protein